MILLFIKDERKFVYWWNEYTCFSQRKLNLSWIFGIVGYLQQLSGWSNFNFIIANAENFASQKYTVKTKRSTFRTIAKTVENSQFSSYNLLNAFNEIQVNPSINFKSKTF